MDIYNAKYYGGGGEADRKKNLKRRFRGVDRNAQHIPL